MSAPTTLPEVEAALARLERTEEFKRRCDLGAECRWDLRKFIRGAWPIVEPAKPLVDNWHIDAIGEHLQAVADGKIRYLLINVGPGYAKSLLVAVCFSAWLWTRNPQIRILCGTYAGKLSIRDSIRVRTLIESDWYKQTFIETLPREKQWGMVKRNEDHLENDRMGFRMALSVDSVGLGLRGDGQILDDVLNAKEAHSESARRTARRWVFETMSSRFNDMRKGWRVAVGQRLHELDPYGEMLATGNYEHLMLPTEFEPHRRCHTVIGFTDPRQKAGELLFPEMFNDAVVAQAKTDLGAMGYNGQHQQRPAPAEGGMIKRHWWRFWQHPGMVLPAVRVMMPDGSDKEITPVYLPDLQERAQSWDLAFKNTSDSDYVVGQCWGRRGADRYLLDQVRKRMDLPQTMKAIDDMSKRHPGGALKLVEDKANGPAVIQMLQHKISGLVAVTPDGGKVARAAAMSPIVESGNVYLPHPQISPWVDEFIEELANFPTAAHDDMVDCASQLINRWSRNTSEPKPLSHISGRNVRTGVGGGMESDRSWMA